MNPHARRARLSLQPLEGRDVPANLTVTFSPLTHTLTVVGDAADNDVTVRGDAADPTHFTLTSPGTINGLAGPFSSPAGVQNLAFKMLGGNDRVTLDNAVPIHLPGNLSVDGGDGANGVQAYDLTVDKSVSVTNGVHAAGVNFTIFTNLSVGRNVSIRTGDGDTVTGIQRSAAGVSTIRGSLRVTNGGGQDTFSLNDTNVDGGVTVNNGHGDAAGTAGRVQIYNQYNTAFRSVIGGNVSVTYLDGNGTTHDGIWDTEVRGNVTLNHGAGAFVTQFDGYRTAQPVLVRGNLTVTGTGANSLRVGVTYNQTGLVVGKKFTATSGGGADATVTINRLQVGGDTSITLGDGNDTVSIDDSLFAGAFTLTTGAGNDTVSLETTAGTPAAAVFEKAVRIALGEGTDTLNVAAVFGGSGTPDAGQVVVFGGPAVATGWDRGAAAYGHEFFPHGGYLRIYS